MDATKAAQLAAIPKHATRVQVVDEFGKTRYRPVRDVADGDTIVLGTKGAPIVMSTRPGRPGKMPFIPTSPRAAEVMKQKEEFLEEDELLAVISTSPEKSEVLDYVLKGLAEEAASLAFERIDAERTGATTSQVSMRRIGALKAVADSWLKRKELIANAGVDMDSPAFKRLFKFVLETLKDTLGDAGIRPEMVETVFTALSKKLDDDWTREAHKRMSEA